MADLGGGGGGGDALPPCRKKGATPKGTGVGSVKGKIQGLGQKHESFDVYDGDGGGAFLYRTLLTRNDVVEEMVNGCRVQRPST